MLSLSSMQKPFVSVTPLVKSQDLGLDIQPHSSGYLKLPSLKMRYPLSGMINFPVCMAPMVGLSHAALRRLVRSYLPPTVKTLWPTEMLNSRRIPGEKLGKTPETFRFGSEDLFCPQILGNEEKFLKATVDCLETWGVDAIDINMGCPVKKALVHNYGVALMGDADYAAQVVEWTAEKAKCPVTVKLRAGIESDSESLLKFISRLASAGAAWITLHPRLAHQQRRGNADWATIGKIRNDLKIPVIGNGDIQVEDDIWEMLAQTQCDVVMVGRALTARPWMLLQAYETFYEIPEHLRRAPRTDYEEGAEYGRALVKMCEWMQEIYPTELGLRKFRFFVKYGSCWLEFGHTLFTVCTKAQTWPEMIVAIQKFFEQPQRMLKRTNLKT